MNLVYLFCNFLNQCIFILILGVHLLYKEFIPKKILPYYLGIMILYQLIVMLLTYYDVIKNKDE